MRRAQNGFVLPVVLILVILVAVGSAVIVTRTTTARQEAQVHAVAAQAFWAVEGALETAGHAVRNGQAPPSAVRIAGQDVVVDAKREGDHWLVRARTRPNAAEVHATLDATGSPVGWKRIR